VSSANVSGASFPDTATCDVPINITFPSTTTVGKEHLAVFECLTADFNSGDFVTAWISDASGSPVYTISQFAETDAGVEWIKPMSDASGKAWDRVYIDPTRFDCNLTGVPYTIHAFWDDQNATQLFNVVCPTIEFTKYRTSVSYWEVKVLQLNANEDANAITIKQENVEVFSNHMGVARFEYKTGLLQDLLQGLDYTVEVSCLGGDGNFVFEIGEQDSDYLRNPLYYFVKWIGDNALALCATVFLFTAVMLIVYGLFFRQ